MLDVNNFESMRIGLASPGTNQNLVLWRSKETETINYRTLKPERDGLFLRKNIWTYQRPGNAIAVNTKEFVIKVSSAISAALKLPAPKFVVTVWVISNWLHLFLISGTLRVSRAGWD